MSGQVEAADLEAARKRFSQLQALYALAGYELIRARDGYIVKRNRWQRNVRSLLEVCEFAVRIGVVRVAPVETDAQSG